MDMHICVDIYREILLPRTSFSIVDEWIRGRKQQRERFVERGRFRVHEYCSISVLAPSLARGKLLESPHDALLVINHDAVSVGGHTHLTSVHLIGTCEYVVFYSVEF